MDKNNSINEISQLILTKAKYQKVVLCLDENSDMEFVDNLSDKIKKDVILLKYYYNKHNTQTFLNMVNNGVRVVVYNVELEHFYNLQTNNSFVLNIFLPQSSFLLPYISNVESVYGDNLLVCDTSIKDYTTLLFLYEMALSKIWELIVQQVEVDTTIFKNIDALANGKIEFYSNLILQIKYLQSGIGNEYRDIDENQLPYYIYLRACATLKMLETLNQNNEQYIDFFKTEKSSREIEKAHSLIIKYKLIDMLKYNS
ncbi:MAG: hypothetical protein IJ371_06665, partial [Clostridia bacterium]|nr:hypothetical protein [Clostridia bacterium]